MESFEPVICFTLWHVRRRRDIHPDVTRCRGANWTVSFVLQKTKS
jgi:hypothetical protein